MNEILAQAPCARTSSNCDLSQLSPFQQKKSRESLRDVAIGSGLLEPNGSLGKHCEITGDFDTRKQDFQLQKTAQNLLNGWKNPKGKAYRIVHCTHSVQSKMLGVTVLMGASGKAKYSGLQTCGSVWNCRLCQKKITRLREQEIKHAMDVHHASGGTCYMITWTHGHKRNDQLKTMVDSYAKAMSDMTSAYQFKQLVIDFKLNGRIRALETTFGWANGWHPHGHDLWFRDGGELSKAEVKRLKNALFSLWEKFCMKHGLPAPSEKYGVDVTVAWSAAEYMAKFGSDQKWGAGRELTRLNSKKSSTGERFTPFDLLRAFDQGHKPEAMQRLFRDYCDAYYGRRQLHWSKGLKKRFDVIEIDDAEAAEIIEEEHVRVGNISYSNWRKVIKQKRDQRAALLIACEKGGMAAVDTAIAALPVVGSLEAT